MLVIPQGAVSILFKKNMEQQILVTCLFSVKTVERGGGSSYSGDVKLFTSLNALGPKWSDVEGSGIICLVLVDVML